MRLLMIFDLCVMCGCFSYLVPRPHNSLLCPYFFQSLCMGYHGRLGHDPSRARRPCYLPSNEWLLPPIFPERKVHFEVPGPQFDRNYRIDKMGRLDHRAVAPDSARHSFPLGVFVPSWFNPEGISTQRRGGRRESPRRTANPHTLSARLS